MKKSKLIMSVASLCLALAVLCFGVYAVQMVNYTLSGNITYEVTDAFVEVQTKIYSSPELMNGPTMLDKVYELGDADFNASETYTGLSFVKSIGKYSSVSDGNSFEDNTLNLTLNQDAKTYFVVINVKNLSSEINVWAVINDTIFNIPENVLERDNAIQQDIGLLNAGTDNKNIVIALSIKDQTKSIPQDSTFKFGIKVGTGDYSQTTENLNKLTFAENIPGETYQVTGVASNAGGVLVIPKIYNNLPVDYIIEDESFDGSSTTISTMIINAQLNSIGVNTFLGFENDLHTVIFPNTLQDIGVHIFVSCFNIEHIYVPDGDGTPFTSFYNGKEVDAIINKTTQTLVTGCNGTNFESLTGITSIQDYAFSHCKEITSITIPSGVTSIGYRAFDHCTGLTTIEIPSGVTSIEGYAFDGCTSLTQIVNNSASITAYDLPTISGKSWYKDDVVVTKINGVGTYLCK